MLTAVNATPTVERVVVTSSTAAIFTDGTERGRGHVFTEHDWNIIATPTKFPYFYSKKMAELVSLCRIGVSREAGRSSHTCIAQIKARLQLQLLYTASAQLIAIV